MSRDFTQTTWDETVDEDCRHLVRLAIREDLEREQDWTTLALAPPDRVGAASIVARQAGVMAGVPALHAAVDEFDARLDLRVEAVDGQSIAAGARIAHLRGNVRDLLTCERTLLNLLGRLMGVATRTQQFVALTEGTRCRVYDTRKTTPGWRRLEKYAVRCGGGHNHRVGLYDAVLIKDNHLAQFGEPGAPPGEAAAAAVRQARSFLRELSGERSHQSMIVEIEVDSLEQLAAVLPERPDIVLLDNMAPDQLAEAVAVRDQCAPGVELEASGGVTLQTLPLIAATGVDRVSVGGLTHSAVTLDVAMDFAAS